MFPIPAIDIKDGNVVRLLHGDFKEEKVYLEKPEAVAKRYADDGAQRIHVVDLDGALKGEPKNIDGVERILKRVQVPVEVGGGIRSLKIADRYFQMGASFVILGTKACLDPGFAREALQAFGKKIIVGIDALCGYVATDGWTKVTKVPALELAKEMEKLGASAVIYTDISKDGAMKGPNVGSVGEMAKTVSMDVIASGGVGALADLTALGKLRMPNVTGVIIGKALYENKFTLKEAIRQCSQNV